MKEIPNEHPNETDIRKETVINEFQAEIQLLKVRAERDKSNYTKVDDEMANFLQSKFNGNELAELKILWDEDIADEEAKSQSKWQSKQEWLEKYEEFDNEDLVKARNDMKPNNSSPHRQRNARHNNERKATREKHHVPTRAEFPTNRKFQRSVNPQATSKESRPLNNQRRNPTSSTSRESNQRHTTRAFHQNSTTCNSHQSNQRYETSDTRNPTTHAFHQSSQPYEQNPTTQSSHQSRQYYDTSNTRNEHTRQNRENSATIPSTLYSDVPRQLPHFEENPSPGLNLNGQCTPSKEVLIF